MPNTAPLRRCLALLAMLILAPAAMAQQRPSLGGIGTEDKAEEPAVAQDGNPAAKATVELIAATTQVRPGQTIDVGIKFAMQPGWHIYWKNPGDAGQPPRFRWNAPGGGAARAMRGSQWQLSDPLFPTPVRWEDAGGIVGFGYAGTVVFPATLTVPGGTMPGQDGELSVSVDYLICKDVCLPESATATLTFSVAADDGEAGNDAGEKSAKEIEQAKAALPVPASDAKVTADGDRHTIALKLPAGAKDVAFFPNVPDGLAVEEVNVQVKGAAATVTFRTRTLAGAAASQPAFDATVGYTIPEGRRGLEVSVPIQPAPAKPGR